MLGQFVAILAPTLLLSRLYKTAGLGLHTARRSPRGMNEPSAAAALSVQPQPCRQLREDEEVEEKGYVEEDVLSYYPQTGRFGKEHRTGVAVESGDRCCLPAVVVAAPAGAADEGWEESFMAAVGALVMSGTALALRSFPEDEVRQYRRRRRRRRPHPDVAAATAAAVERLQVELSSNLDTLHGWSRRIRSQRASMAAAKAQRRRRRRRWVSHFLSPRRTSALAAAVAREQLGQLSEHLLEVTASAGRGWGPVFSAARASGDLGLRFVGYGNLLYRHGRGMLVRGVRELGRRRRRGGHVEETDTEEGEWEGSRLALLMDQTVQNVVDVVARDGWEHVATTSGVVVHRQYIALAADGTPIKEEEVAAAGAAAAAETGGLATSTTEASAFAGGSTGAAGPAAAAAVDGDKSTSSGSAGTGKGKTPRFACVKATAIISVPPEVVYLLFADNSRVSEYNEHCREVKDLEVLSEDSKITWAASGRMGPFKARDFCTLVHFRTLSDGTLAQVSRPVEHPAAPRSSRYVRSEVLLAGNFMRPVPGDPSKTEFLMVTHVNPGGAAETRAGAMLVNSLCASSPVNFIRRLEVAAQKLMLDLQQQKQQQQPQQQPQIQHQQQQPQQQQRPPTVAGAASDDESSGDGLGSDRHSGNMRERDGDGGRGGGGMTEVEEKAGGEATAEGGKTGGGETNENEGEDAESDGEDRREAEGAEKEAGGPPPATPTLPSTVVLASLRRSPDSQP